MTAHPIVVSDSSPDDGPEVLEGFGVEDQRSVLHIEATEDAFPLGVVVGPSEDVEELYSRPQESAGPRIAGEHRIPVLMDDHALERGPTACQRPFRFGSRVESQSGVRPFPDREADDVAGRVVEERDQPSLSDAASEAEFSEVCVKDLKQYELRLVPSRREVRPAGLQRRAPAGSHSDSDAEGVATADPGAGATVPPPRSSRSARMSRGAP